MVQPIKRLIEVVDPLAIKATDPDVAVKTFELDSSPRVVPCDILITGGGIAGISAMLSAAQSGLIVCLTEETDWLGGQITSQGVPALDENYLVETTGVNLSYKKLREAIRNHYRANYRLSEKSAAQKHFNPGNCWVSRLAFEPGVAVELINHLLSAKTDKGNIHIYMRYKPVAARMSRGKVHSLTMVNLDDGQFIQFRPKFCVDATELGDLLPLCSIDYVSGEESREMTGEIHAPERANPANVQDFVYPFVLEYRPGEKHTMDKPADFEKYEAQFSLNGYSMFRKSTLVNTDGTMVELLPFWEYRRLIDREMFSDPAISNDIAVINWDSNDLRSHNIIDMPPQVMARNLATGKALSLSFLHWLQTKAPRDEGGNGYPEFKLRLDLLGTADGLSKYPYIRESRRIKSKRLVRHEDISTAHNKGARARNFRDSVGIGLYPIDIHGEHPLPADSMNTKPFQLPLGILLPEKNTNLIAAGKCIGTTHITNGAYRLHPIEWASGEAAGMLAVFCLQRHKHPYRVLENNRLLTEFQEQLTTRGIPVYWWDDVGLEDTEFTACQILGLTGVMPGAINDLHFRPHDPITLRETALALSRMLQLAPDSSPQPGWELNPEDTNDRLIAAVLKRGGLRLDPGQKFEGRSYITDSDLNQSSLASLGGYRRMRSKGSTVTRGEFAAWLYHLARSKRRRGWLI